jgi:hypothetical protein
LWWRTGSLEKKSKSRLPQHSAHRASKISPKV